MNSLISSNVSATPNLQGIEVTKPATKPATKPVYQADHQTKFLNLQADAESLLQRLEAIKQERDDDDEEDVFDQPVN
jgi:hypothetical protein